MKNHLIISIDTGIEMIHYHGKEDSVENHGRASEELVLSTDRLIFK